MPEMLDEEAEKLLERLDDKGLPPSSSLSIDSSRKIVNDMLTHENGAGGVEKVYNLSIVGPVGDIPIRIYQPKADRFYPVIAFFHGGAWIRGSINTHDHICRSIASESNCIVVSVEYSLAPEFHFPTQVEEAYTTIGWLADNAEYLKGDSDRIAVAGDSAGGNIAAAAALLATHRGGPQIKHQLLLYPVTDYSFDTPSYQENSTGYLLTRDTMIDGWNHYLESPIDGANPYASVLRARNVEGVAPTTVLTCGYDPLLSEGRSYAEKLENADVPVNYIEYKGMIHSFLSFPELTKQSEAIQKIGGILNDSLSR